jgi:hypothetical protein
MPAKPVQDGDKWCIEDSAGKRHGGCHDSREDALAQARAINANKEIAVSEIPGKASSSNTFTINMTPGADDPDFRERVTGIVKDMLSKTLAPRSRGEEKDQEPESPLIKGEPGFMVWKGDNGRWHWLARYSNSFRDNDNPPEIISSESHKRFVKMVDAGEYPYPELWLWHEKAWKWGEATVVSFDEVEPGMGFALAGGLVDEGKEWIAEKYANGAPARVSHGMPGPEIVRDPQDKSIYLQHQTTEISPLPPNKAANELTGFYVIKEKNMAHTDEKRQEMADNLGTSVDALRKVEQSNADTGKAAAEGGVEYKEKAPEKSEPEQEAGKETTEAKEGVVYVTAQEFQEFTSEFARGFQDVMQEVTGQLKELKEEFKAINDEKEAEKKALTPGASIYDHMMGSIQKHVLKSAEDLEDSKPKETDAPPQQPFANRNPGITFLDEMHQMNAREANRS